MAHFTRLEVYDAILKTGLVPLFYHNDTYVARQVVEACARGGAQVLELTMRGVKALRVFSDLVDYVEASRMNLVLGIGTILDAPSAALYIAHGASFIGSPVFNPEIAKLCNRHKVAYLPGCGSATEISDAEELGAEIVALFPGGAVGGPEFIRAIHGPMPWTRVMPSGGVDATQESVASWIKAGAACLGMGSQLVRRDWIIAADYAEIEKTVRSVSGWIKEARKG